MSSADIRKAHDLLRHLMKIVEEHPEADDARRERLVAAADLVDSYTLASACGCAGGMADMTRKLAMLRIEEMTS